MTHKSLYSRRVLLLTIVFAFVAAMVLPVLLRSNKAAAWTQLTDRKITLSSSVVSKVDATYAVSFKAASTGNIRGIIVDFCTSPLIGTVCTAPTGLDVDKTNLNINTLVGISATWTVDTTNSSTNKVQIQNASGGSISAGTTVGFTLGNGGANGITNPSTNGTFYARILTYATDTAGDTYDSSSTGSNNPPAATVDAGGVAMSTASQLTVTARVQEQLAFCVGTITNGGSAPATCAAMTGTSVDLGVVDSSGAISPVATANAGNNVNGGAMVRTNASLGVVIDYFAEQAGSGTNHLGALRVSGATCNAGTVATDQCFTSAGTTQTAFSASTEDFGMTASSIDTTSSTTPTANLVRDGQYDGDGTLSGGFAWDETGTFDRLASSAGGAQPENRVVDDEMLLLRFAAVSAVTTPTGQYTVTSTYVATPTF